MIAGELAHCRHLHLAGIGLGVLNEILKRLIRAVFGNHDHVGVVNEAAKRAELFRFVARLPFGAQHGLEHDMGEVHAADGVAVRRPRRPCRLRRWADQKHLWRIFREVCG